MTTAPNSSLVDACKVYLQQALVGKTYVVITPKGGITEKPVSTKRP